MKTKKIFAVILAVMLIISAFPFCAFASEERLLYTKALSPRLFGSPADMTGSVEKIESLVDTDEFREYLLGEFLSCNTNISVSAFNIPVKDSEAVSDFIWYHMPEAFGVDKLSFAYYSMSGNIVNLVVEYSAFSDTPAEYESNFEAFTASADKMLSGIENNSSLSDTEKALLLHDRLAVYTEYDFDASERVVHTAYGAFADRLAVCQGYAMAYMYLLNRVGIKNFYCSSELLNHGWNIVEINGKTYHVDVTWDDASYGIGAGVTGKVIHNNFLRSTEGIKTTGHDAEDFDMSPCDTSFDNSFWQSSSSEFILLGNDIYYIESTDGSIDASVKNMRTGAVVHSFSEHWMQSEGYAWSGNFSCLSKSGNSLLLSYSRKVLTLNPANGITETVYSPEITDYCNIFGMTYEDGFIICDINDSLNSDTNLSRVKYKFEAVCTHTVTENIKGTPASCTEDGISDAVMCKDCRKILSGNTPVSALGHDKTVHTAKNPTCTEKGWNEYFICSRCNYSTYEELPATGHTEVTDTAVSPSCTETGLSEGKHCGVCGYIIKKQETVPAAGHIEVKHEEKPASCILKGHNAYVTCEKCGYSTFSEIGIDPENHINTENIPETPPASESIGYTAGVYCNDCKKFISGHNEIPKTEAFFTDSENTKTDGSDILVNSGLTAKQLLSQASSYTVIRDMSGAVVNEDTLAATGMTLVLSDGKSFTLIIMGDTDGDGRISAADARNALRTSVGLEKMNDIQKKAADVDKKDKISASDARLILRASVKLEDTKEWIK